MSEQTEFRPSQTGGGSAANDKLAKQDLPPIAWSDSPKTIASYFKNLWEEVKNAISVDTKATDALKSAGSNTTSHVNLFRWIKSTWVVLLILILSLVVVYRFVKNPVGARRSYRRGHHGVNAYGRRY